MTEKLGDFSQIRLIRLMLSDCVALKTDYGEIALNVEIIVGNLKLARNFDVWIALVCSNLKITILI